MITEDQLEQLAIQWFQGTGWSYMNGTVISPEGEAPEREEFSAIKRCLTTAADGKAIRPIIN